MNSRQLINQLRVGYFYPKSAWAEMSPTNERQNDLNPVCSNRTPSAFGYLTYGFPASVTYGYIPFVKVSIPSTDYCQSTRSFDDESDCTPKRIRINDWLYLHDNSMYLRTSKNKMCFHQTHVFDDPRWWYRPRHCFFNIAF